ncbi:MAG: hypothetical protein JNK04_12845 [Myxococcales bacterium]|nr:hypothetical protein [Myxococcales bacterium]
MRSSQPAADEAQRILSRALARNRREAPIALVLAGISVTAATSISWILPHASTGALLGARTGLLALAATAMYCRARLAREFVGVEPRSSSGLLNGLLRERILLREAPFWFSIPVAASGAFSLLSIASTPRTLALTVVFVATFAAVALANLRAARRIDGILARLSRQGFDAESSRARSG